MDLLLLLIAPAWAWVSWKRPQTGFALLPFFLPLYVLRTHIGPLPTTALELAIIGLAAGWLLARKKSGLTHAWQQCAAWRIPLGLWVGAGAISVLTAAINGYDIWNALGLFRAYIIEPVLVFIIGRDLLRDHKHRTNVFLAITAVAVLLAAYAIFQYITGIGIPHPWDTWPGRRATGPFPFPNALALFLVPFGALAAAWMVNKPLPTHVGERQRYNRIAPIALFVAAGISALLASSDGGLIALAAALVCALLMKKGTRIPTIAAIAALAIAALAITPIRENVAEKIFFQEWSGKVRTIIWQETGQLIQDNPFFGAGLAAYPQAILPYHTATWMEVFQYPHNIVLNLWTEMGIPGLLAFLAIILFWIREARRTDVSLPIILAILVHGLVDVPYFKNDLAVAFWILILLTVTYREKEPTAA